MADDPVDVHLLKSNLDHDNDAHWTKSGKPSLERAQEILQRPVNRAWLDQFGIERRQEPEPKVDPVQSDEEIAAEIVEKYGCRPLAAMKAFEAMSIGNQFIPPLQSLLLAYQASRPAINEFAKRVRDRQIAQAKGKEAGGLQRLRYKA